MKYILLIFSILFLVNCQNVIISKNHKYKITRHPDYEDTKWFFLFGGVLPITKEINLEKICLNKKVAQIQSVITFWDSLIIGSTFGIANPRTIRVWCEH